MLQKAATDMRVPAATYRLQFNSGFGFSDALRLIPYLHALGISDLYASPIFAARPGSAHGYDITDPLRLNPELGTDSEFEALVQALQERGMGLLLDIVPNHMAATAENAWWADVLEHGPSSEYAGFFDIDWGRGGEKVVLPILSSPLGQTLEAGELTLAVDDKGPCIRYHDTRLPIASKSYPLARRLAAQNRPDLRALLAEQPYRLAYWREGTREINYRRFFDISDLVGLRVEDRDVFEATHAFILELARQGKVTGLRVDHIDGLLDPAGYLTRLQSHLTPEGDKTSERPAFYLVVEKILTGAEELPAQWPVAGTTGYDFLNLVNGLFVDVRGLQALRSAYAAFVGSTATFADIVYEQKRRMARELFPGELQSLTGRLASIAEADPAAKGLRTEEMEEALVEVSACLPVYRIYAGGRGVSDRDKALVGRALDEAGRRNRAVSERALRLLQRVLLLDTSAALAEGQRDAWLGFVMQWQQFTGPLTAKGLEDTALYVYNPLLSLNEVGADPEGAGTVTVDEFHQRSQERAQRWPHTMSATATHDTKRGEDTRARINVLSELADEWSAHLRRWSERNRDRKTLVDGHPVPDANEEVLLYQTLIGAWPLDEGAVPGFKERLKAYVVKAAREAKVHTSWLDVDLRHEEALGRLVDAILSTSASNTFLADLLDFQQKIAYYGAINSLAQVLLKIASPGVPDFYQGTELWDFTLVDPDNRRPVDFERRTRMVEGLLRQEAEDPLLLVQDLVERWQDGRIKLYVTAKALRFRSSHADLFRAGDYLPLQASGERRECVVAFVRRRREDWALAVVPRLVTQIAKTDEPRLATTGWGDTILPLPANAPARWTNVITGEVLETPSQRAAPALPLGSMFAHAPVALLSGSNH